MTFQLFLIFTYLAIFVSGINHDTIFLSIIISFLAGSIGLILLLKGGKGIKFPRHFGYMVVFILIQDIYLLFVSDKLNPFYYSVLFTEGALYWLIFYNLKNGGVALRSMLVYLAVIYASVYFLSQLFNVSLTKLAGLIFTQDFPRHYYFGALCASLIAVIVGAIRNNMRIWHLPVLILGIIFLVISANRTADIALFLGLSYLFVKNPALSKLSKVAAVAFMGLAVGLFVYTSASRTVLFERPYFLQSINAVATHPLGVGIGNFRQIEEEFKSKGVSNTKLSIYTHNLYLESLSGLGVFSLPFLIFLVLIFRDILYGKGSSIIWGSLVLILLANFMTDTSYTLPGLLWLFFIAIGVFQSEKQDSLRIS